jgi:hypothetical protein
MSSGGKRGGRIGTRLVTRGVIPGILWGAALWAWPIKGRFCEIHHSDRHLRADIPGLLLPGRRAEELLLYRTKFCAGDY